MAHNFKNVNKIFWIKQEKISKKSLTEATYKKEKEKWTQIELLATWKHLNLKKSW